MCNKFQEDDRHVSGILATEIAGNIAACEEYKTNINLQIWESIPAYLFARRQEVALKKMHECNAHNTAHEKTDHLLIL